MRGGAIWELLDLKQRTWGKGLKQKWPEILILIIMIPAFIWLLKLAAEQNSRMIALETRLSAFVNAMPELRRGIASAAINQRLRSAMIVSRPIAVGEAWEGKIEVWTQLKGTSRRMWRSWEKPPSKCLRPTLLGASKGLTRTL